MTRYTYNMARRLYVEGYGIKWAMLHSGLTLYQLERAIQLPYGEQGPVKRILCIYR